MTQLTKPVKRQTSETVQNGKHRGRNIIVTLIPPSQISFRIKGTQQTFETTIYACYQLAIKQHAINDYNAKMKEYKAGIRKRRPAKPNYF